MKLDAERSSSIPSVVFDLGSLSFNRMRPCKNEQHARVLDLASGTPTLAG